LLLQLLLHSLLSFLTGSGKSHFITQTKNDSVEGSFFDNIEFILNAIGSILSSSSSYRFRLGFGSKFLFGGSNRGWLVALMSWHSTGIIFLLWFLWSSDRLNSFLFERRQIFIFLWLIFLFLSFPLFFGLISILIPLGILNFSSFFPCLLLFFISPLILFSIQLILLALHFLS